MPAINNVTVTNAAGQNWGTNSQADGPDPFPAGGRVFVTATVANPPPAGFFPPGAAVFTIQGQYVAHGGGFNSGALPLNPALSEPPGIFVFG